MIEYGEGIYAELGVTRKYIAPLLRFRHQMACRSVPALKRCEIVRGPVELVREIKWGHNMTPILVREDGRCMWPWRPSPDEGGAVRMWGWYEAVD